MIDGFTKLLQDALRDQPAQVFAFRRWLNPDPGMTYCVLTTPSTWASGPGSSRYPVLQVEFWARPDADQDNADELLIPVTDRVVQALQWVDGAPRRLSDGTRVLMCHLAGEVGSSEVEGHQSDGWRWARQTYECLVA